MDQALADPFVNIELGANGQLRQDLAELEEKVGQRWLTSYEQLNEDEERSALVQTTARGGVGG